MTLYIPWKLLLRTYYISTDSDDVSPLCGNVTHVLGHNMFHTWQCQIINSMRHAVDYLAVPASYSEMARKELFIQSKYLRQFFVDL
jgi:hypothetical protein